MCGNAGDDALPSPVNIQPEPLIYSIHLICDNTSQAITSSVFVMMLTDLPTSLPTAITACSSRLSKSPKDSTWLSRPLPYHSPKPGRPHTIHSEYDKPEEMSATSGSSEPPSQPQAVQNHEPGAGLQDLPEEIQQSILDILMGTLGSISSSAVDKTHAMRNWSSAMRHPRCRQLSDLTLVSGTWRRMIQERLYRHIKIKGTQAGLEECADWFLTNIHLQQYVRHIEIWVPVWERRAGQFPQFTELSGNMTYEQHEISHNVLAVTTIATPNRRNSQEVENINQAYKLASSNATLDEIFACTSCLFPEVCILTIEGGHCKKPPMIRQFRENKKSPLPQRLSRLPSIRTLVLKGAWNLLREQSDFDIIASALPNIREWHCTYSKPKTKAYHTICSVIRHFPQSITHLNICLEGFYSKEITPAAKMRVLQLEHHLCRDLGRIIPQLEALTFTGRVCHTLFTSAIEAAVDVRKPRLKSLDLVVKNCCRDIDAFNDGTGIHNGTFIHAFETLVISGVRSLLSYPELNFLRIRFIDLDAPCPLLNPYFQLQHRRCTGLWNEEILDIIGRARPLAAYAELAEGLGMQGLDKEGRVVLGWPLQRPRSIKIGSYAAFEEGGTQPQ